MFNAADIKPDNPHYDQKDTEYFYQRQRFFEINNSDNGDKRGADSGPDSIGDTDIYFLESNGQAHKRETVKHKNQYRRN